MENSMRGEASTEVWKVKTWATWRQIHTHWKSYDSHYSHFSQNKLYILFSSVSQLCLTPCDPMDCSTPGLPLHDQLREFTQTHVHWVSESIQPSHALSSPSPPAFNFPSIRVFSNKSILCIRWPKYWTFSFSISPSNEYSGLFSFRMDCLDLHAVQGTLKSLLQHHKSKASILQCSAFFIVQLSSRWFRLWLY